MSSSEDEKDKVTKPTLKNDEDKSQSEPPPSPTSPPQSTSTYSVDDLTQLIKAIKFAYPDYGIKRVHREIVEVAAVKGNEPSLKDIKLNEVKKILKSLDNDDNEEENRPWTTTDTGGGGTTNKVLKMYTVGDGSVKALTEDYSRQAAAKAAMSVDGMTSQGDDTTIDEKTTTTTMGQWEHFFLDVPADRSGKKPHQALINFNVPSQKKDDTSESGHKGGKKGKKKGGSGKQQCVEDVVKIQVAAGIPGMDGFKMPMLLYNSDRTAKTFIHPEAKGNDANDDADQTKEDGYDCIQRLIVSAGTGGALGTTGGKKGYFRCRINKAKGIVSVDVSEMVAGYQW